MKSKMWKLFVSILTLIFSILSAMIGYGFMIGADIPFLEKFGYGFIFMVTPVLVIQMMIQMFKKEKPKIKEKQEQENIALEVEEDAEESIL